MPESPQGSCLPPSRGTFQREAGAGQTAACALQGTFPSSPARSLFRYEQVGLVSKGRENCANKSPFLPKSKLPSCEVDGKTPVDLSEGRTGPSVSASPRRIRAQTHAHIRAYSPARAGFRKPETLGTILLVFPEWIYNPSNTVHSECVTKRTDLQETICLHDDCILWHF